jgi:hypothetical protein
MTWAFESRWHALHVSWRAEPWRGWIVEETFFFDRPSILALQLQGPLDRSRLLEYPSVRDTLGKHQVCTKNIEWKTYRARGPPPFGSTSITLEVDGKIRAENKIFLKRLDPVQDA